MQETHSISEDEKCWRNEWRGVMIQSHGTNKECGTLVAIRNGFPINVERYVTDKCGRYIILQLRYEEIQYVLCTVYAPNRDTPSFFVKLFKDLEDFEGKCIMVGDFNLALNSELDRKSTRGRVCNNDISTEVLNKYIEDTQMCDVWRERNPELRHFTYRKLKPYVGRRIDFFFIDQSLEISIRN